MRGRCSLALLALVALAVAAAAGAASHATRKAPRLVHPRNLVYRGGFRLPEPLSDQKTFSYGGTALAYDPVHKGLFAVGHDWYQLTAEVSIPKLVRSSNVERLNRARYIQPFRDATGGTIDQAGDSSNKVGGQLVYAKRLYGTVYVYYDAAGEQKASHWARPSTSLRTGKVRGLFHVGKVDTGFTSGYLGQVASAWKERLGGPVLTGNCCIPIISRTSFGPGLFSFDPLKLGKVKPVPARPLVYYTQDHHTLGNWDDSWSVKRGIVFNGTTSIKGIVFPAGTDTVLFFGTQGVGKFCYGIGTDRKPPPSDQCYDPDDSSKGTHAYPYRPEVWAYDAKDLLAVRQGRRKPWAVRPYATWRLSLPLGSPRIGGAAYDPKTGRIFVSQQFGDGDTPVIQVFTVR